MSAEWLNLNGAVFRARFVLASFYNALCLAAAEHRVVADARISARAAYRCRACARLALACTQLGGVAFVSGSVLYRPGLATDCGAAAERAAICVDAVAQGTALYVIGSVLFLAQSLLNFASSIVRTRGDLAHPLFSRPLLASESAALAPAQNRGLAMSSPKPPDCLAATPHAYYDAMAVQEEELLFGAR